SEAPESRANEEVDRFGRVALARYSRPSQYPTSARVLPVSRSWRPTPPRTAPSERRTTVSPSHRPLRRPAVACRTHFCPSRVRYGCGTWSVQRATEGSFRSATKDGTCAGTGITRSTRRPRRGNRRRAIRVRGEVGRTAIPSPSATTRGPGWGEVEEHSRGSGVTGDLAVLRRLFLGVAVRDRARDLEVDQLADRHPPVYPDRDLHAHLEGPVVAEPLVPLAGRGVNVDPEAADARLPFEERDVAVRLRVLLGHSEIELAGDQDVSIPRDPELLDPVVRARVQGGVLVDREVRTQVDVVGVGP